MISRFHKSLFQMPQTSVSNEKALINFVKAEKEIREMFKRSLELNVENKRMSIISVKKDDKEDLNDTVLDDEELNKPVSLALNTIMDKHGRLDQKKL